MPKSYIGSVTCKNCGILFSKRIDPKTKRHYCSKQCRMSDKDSYKSEWSDERRATQSEKFKGKNNPNFGNHWSEEQRAAGSFLKKKQFLENPEYRYKVGASNRGVKFSAERINRMHRHRSSDSYRRVHTEEVKSKIGKKSKEKWTDEFKLAHRKTMERLGHWVSEEKIPPYRKYYKDANWIENMVNYFNSASLKNLKEHGMFSRTNTKGYVRDHIVPRKLGYEYNLPPCILRHPANLQFISHSDNIIKGFNDRMLTSTEKECIINELLDRILKFDQVWKEQEICINFIKERRSL